MKFSSIVFLSDLFRCNRAASEGFFAFVREPIRQGSGIDPGWPPTAKKNSALLSGFDLHEFRMLAGLNAMNAAYFWRQTWHTAPIAAVDYLCAHIPPKSLVLSYDMPRWLAEACMQRGISWLDMRPSPLAFGRDLYVALRASDATLQKRLAHMGVPDEELRLEAALLEANLHAHRLDVEEGFLYKFNLDACLVFIGQHPEDVAVLSSTGKPLRCSDFSQQLHAIAQGRTVLHLLDTRNLARSTLFGEHQIQGLEGLAHQERQSLEKLLGVTVKPCQQSIYQVLSSHDDVEIVGISAPALQEAAWFGKKSHTLLQPYTPLVSMDAPLPAGYLQAHFSDVLKPAFWHAILSPDTSSPVLAALPELERNQARTALNNWGGYEQVTTWERPLHRTSFERSGGNLLRQRIEKLERLQSTEAKHDTTAAMRKKIQTFKNSRQGLTAYVLGNGPSLKELDIAALLKVDSFWCNRAYEMEQQGIEFLPPYYFISDRMGFQDFGERAIEVKAQQKFFREPVADLARQKFPQAFIDQCIISYGNKASPLMFEGDGFFSTDPSHEVNPSYTVVMDAIQFAFYMGYENVYVGGVDLDYSKNPYFFNEKLSDGAPRAAWVENMKKSFIVAKRHFEQHGRSLKKMTKSPNLPLDYIKSSIFSLETPNG